MVTSMFSLVFLVSFAFSLGHVVPNNQQDHEDQPPDTPCDCNDAVKPVCGKDNMSYNNTCLASCASVEVACYGKCPCTAKSCEDSIGTHLDGESWQCEDGCNTCFCRNGLISSTRKLCPVLNTSKSCIVATISHLDGESWLCEDGCNTCFCTNGVVSSTMKNCQKSCEDISGTHLDGESWRCADGCNTCYCRNGLISSTEMGCPQSTPSPSGKF